jgi:prepilin-type N-terminal cleavage/methylation domain-containing protein
MNYLYKKSNGQRIPIRNEGRGACLKTGAQCLKTGAFTLPEVLVSAVILGIAFTSAYLGVTDWMLLSHRTGDYTAGMALVQAKMFDIRATDYPGTNGVFSTTSATTNINTVSVDLNKGGTTFLVPGTLTSVIQPITWGHLVTVSLVVKEVDGSYISNSLQTVVNNYSGGRGN